MHFLQDCGKCSFKIAATEMDRSVKVVQFVSGTERWCGVEYLGGVSARVDGVMWPGAWSGGVFASVVKSGRSGISERSTEAMVRRALRSRNGTMGRSTEAMVRQALNE